MSRPEGPTDDEKQLLAECFRRTVESDMLHFWNNSPGDW